MLSKIIAYSVRNPLIIFIGMAVLIGFGWHSLSRIPLDAVPDITNNQVQVVTQSPSLSAEEVEQFITYPLELTLTNLPGVEEVRSISKFGLSILTVIFEEQVPDLDARQLVAEQLSIASAEIPPSLGTPEMMPITTGLGEIYQYVLTVDPSASKSYTPTELRTLHDWVIKRQLGGIKGIIEISSFGGFVKQYEVVPHPEALAAFNLTLSQLGEAIAQNNQSAGGSYFASNHQSFYVRAMGRLSAPEELLQIPVAQRDGGTLLLGQVAHVRDGHAVRFGAMTKDGQGEVVGGITLMLKGDNAHATVKEVRKRMEKVQASLPEGVRIEPYLDRSDLVDRTTKTVAKNLIEGGLIVIAVLVLLLGNLRAGLVVASVIPLAMLFALILMNAFGVSANLMSLGAIDFGIVVDGAVIIAEHLLAVLSVGYMGKKLQREDFQDVVIKSSVDMVKSAVFGVLIILVVFVPIMTLVGIEGKMFRPMAQTVSFALLGALLLSITYIPAMLALVMKRGGAEEAGWSERLMNRLLNLYRPSLAAAMGRKKTVLLIAGALFAATIWQFKQLGSEFIPKLDEGDLAAQMQLPAGTSLEESIATATEAERLLRSHFPQVRHVVSKIGTAEVPTDPMSIEQADIMILLKDPKEWPEKVGKDDLVNEMAALLEREVPYGSFEFTQPIELRFNELISGAKSDIAIKLFGPDLEQLSYWADQMVPLIEGVDGAVDVKREQTDGLNQRHIVYDRTQMAALGLTVQDANAAVEAAFAGTAVSTLYENDQKFDVVIRYAPQFRSTPNLNELFVPSQSGQLVPFSHFSELTYSDGPSLISRENSQRRIVIGCNVRGRDMESVVLDIQNALSAVSLPAGYYTTYGGDYQQLQLAKRRLGIAVPVALAAIFVLLFLSFKSLRLATIVFLTVPLSTIGGVAALALRGMPFSISAGIGFIALFGVAVLNGIVMVAHLSRSDGEDPEPSGAEGEWDREKIARRASERLRPVLMTAFVAALGFLPMALSTGAGAEVQKPLATVVIGGLITATFLTMIVMPLVYWAFGTRPRKGTGKALPTLLLLTALGSALPARAQEQTETRSFSSALSQLRSGGIAAQQAALMREAVRVENRLDWNVPLSSSWQNGQINSADRADYFLTLELTLPSLSAWPALVEVHRKKLEAAESEWAYIEHSQAFALRMNWLDFEEKWRKNAALEQHYERVRALEQRAAARAQLALVPQRDLVRWHVLAEQVHHQWLQSQTQIDQARSSINALVGWNQEAVWSPEELALESLLPENEPESTLLLAPMVDAVALAESELRRAKDAWMPEVSVGAFTQKLEGTPGFNGVQLGASIPLSPHIYRSRVKQSELKRQEQALGYEKAMREWAALVASLKRNLQRWAPDDHHQGISLSPSKDADPDGTAPRVEELWRLYEAGAMDLEALWASIEAYYAQELLTIEHEFHYALSVAEWNYYQKTK